MAKRTTTKTATETVAPKADAYERITLSIVEALEKASGPTEWPWIKAAKAGTPVNVVSGKAYRGLNRMLLGMSVHAGASRFWGTFRQWQEKGAMVRKGSKGTFITFWGDLYVDAAGNRVEKDAPGARKILYAKGATVFSADQVEGWTAPQDGSKETKELAAAEGAGSIEEIDDFIRHVRAEVLVQGDKAFYAPEMDRITMPAKTRFRDTATASATQHYYGVLLHELVHWTGHAKRCSRDILNRFGSETYAFEELVAEIGSAFLSADLGLVPEPRADNVAYVANWLQVLKGDKRAIFTASTASTKAADYLHGLQPKASAEDTGEDHEEDQPAALAA